jgi:putative NADH-flavin reductase
VTAIARRADILPPTQQVTPRPADVNDPDKLAKAIAADDAVVHSVKFANSDARKVVEAVQKSGVKRLLIVGGAGSLEVAPGKQLVDEPNFPAAYKQEALAGREFLNVLRNLPPDQPVDWTYISPSAIFARGKRTGKFRIGTDQLLTDAKGISSISQEDFAIALVDELENPKHSRKRFTVGY